MLGRGQGGSHRVLLDTGGGPQSVKREPLFVQRALGWGPKGITKALGQQGDKEALALIQGEAESTSLSREGDDLSALKPERKGNVTLSRWRCWDPVDRSQM